MSEELNNSTSNELIQKVEKPKRKIQIKKFTRRVKTEDEHEVAGQEPLLGVETVQQEISTKSLLEEFPKLPVETLENKKARLAQYMRRGPLELNSKSIDLLKLESMKENMINAQLESYDYYQNQKTTDVLSDTLLLWSSSGIDKFSGLDGKFTKKCQEDETLKNDIADELSVYGYLISRPVRIISRLCLNFFQALREPTLRVKGYEVTGVRKPELEKTSLPRGGSFEEKNEKIEIVEEKN